ncbi:MAG: helix-hairpin-helix domain-containing protein [Chloroherpetonaceae bacterium]|nr:helix-hairpin-helix domain-containing protein [Chloroherpetonaceae bacterium]MDW8437069.1 helix-hairpin-helix domain-containing protein [Chloroherpetonaceae bacterium]
MRFSHSLLALCCLAVLSGTSAAQETDDLPTQTLDRLLDFSEEQSANSELLEQFNLLRRQKVNLNVADFSRLLSIPFLSAADAKRILAHRKRVNLFASVEELREILDEDAYRLVKNFVTVGDARLYRNPFEPAFISDYKNGMLRDQLRIDYVARGGFESPARQGVLNGRYKGSAPKFYNRFQAFLSENFAFSALTEKDVGEPNVADFYSASFQIRDIYNLKTLVVGDYNLSFGQGLAINVGRAFFKSAEAVATARVSRNPIRLYASSIEQNFFRGAASELKFGDLTTIFFYSNNRLSATRNDSAFTSIDFSGLHRTETELNRKNSVAQTTYGGHLAYAFGTAQTFFRFGATLYESRFSLPYQPSPTLANAFRFNGSRIAVVAANWDMALYDFTLFGEAARSIQQNATSLVLGIEGAFEKRVKTVALARKYAQAFYSPYANAFAERGSQGRNEEGIYFGVQMRLSEEVSARGYYDIFRIPFINASTVLSWSGDDLLFQVSWKPSRQFLIEPLVQRKYVEDALTQIDAFGREYRIAAPARLSRIRTDFVYQVSPQLRLRTRIEFKEVEKTFVSGVDRLNGWLVFQEANIDALQRRLSLDARIAFFQADSFDAALYAYEYDLPLLATTYAHFGSGRRLLLNVRYQAFEAIELAARFANLYRDGVESVGSGNDQFNTNSPSVFGFGIRARF